MLGGGPQLPGAGEGLGGWGGPGCQGRLLLLSANSGGTLYPGALPRQGGNLRTAIWWLAGRRGGFLRRVCGRGLMPPHRGGGAECTKRNGDLPRQPGSVDLSAGVNPNAEL